MKFNKIAGFLIASIIALNVQAFAADMLTTEQAKNIALQYVPNDSITLQTEEDYNKFEIKLYNQKDKTYYEIDIDKTTQKLLSFESESQYGRGSTKVTLSEDAVKNIVLKEIPEAQFVKVELDYDDGLQEYKVHFYTTNTLGKYNINPQNGMILEREIKFVESFVIPQYPILQNQTTQSPPVKTVQAPQNQTNSIISVEQAKQIALSKAPNAIIYKIKLDKDDGRLIYEGEMKQGNIEYEFEIDAQTGVIIEWDAEIDD